MTSSLVPFFLIGLGAAALGCAKATASEAAPGFTVSEDRVELGSGPRPVPFLTEAAKLGEPARLPAVTGRVATVESATVRSFAPLAGRLVEVRVRAGDRVKKGDKLLRVQTAELAELRREISISGLTVKTREALLERLEQLHALRAASDAELLQARSELAEARLRGDASTAVLRSLAVTPADATSYWVIAPRDGTIVSVTTAPGAEVGPGSAEPLAVISDLDEVIVLASVPLRGAGALSPGAAASVSLPGEDGELPGTLETLSEVVEAETQTVAARVRVPNRDRKLRPNGYVEVTFRTNAEDQVVTVPTEAVVSDGARSVVFVEVKPGELAKRVVAVGHEGRERTEIVRGLEAGEHVVTTGALLILNALDIKG